MVTATGTPGSYYEADKYYYITDHLDNVRVITDNSGTVQERNDYYPFGGKHANSAYAQLTVNKYKFNGKELQTTGNTGFLDYGARMYDDVIGRWSVMDPMVDKYYNFSAYTYVANNPIKHLDPDGKKIVDSKAAQRIEKAMIKSETGLTQWKSMVNAKYPISFTISDEEKATYNKQGEKSYLLGVTNKNVAVDKNGKIQKINSIEIVVYEGSIKSYVSENLQNKDEMQELYKNVNRDDDRIAAVAGHESVHSTDKENIQQSYDNKTKHTKYDVENKAISVEMKILNELIAIYQNRNN
jgi:RHS repeat-associated protein